MKYSDHRHGTCAGYAAHQRFDEEPCDLCKRARHVYDKRRRNQYATAVVDRRRARAQSRAESVLRHTYPEEYQEAYRKALADLEDEG